MSEMSTAELLTRMCSNLVTVLPQQRAALDNFRACGGARKQNSVHNKKDCHMLKHVLIRACYELICEDQELQPSTSSTTDLANDHTFFKINCTLVERINVARAAQTC